MTDEDPCDFNPWRVSYRRSGSSWGALKREGVSEENSTGGLFSSGAGTRMGNKNDGLGLAGRLCRWRRQGAQRIRFVCVTQRRDGRFVCV